MDTEQRDLLHSLACIHLACGQARRALALLLLAARGAPFHPGVLRALAYAHTALDEGEAALSVLDRLAACAEAMPEDGLLRARALHRAGRLGEARAAFADYVAARDPVPLEDAA